MVSDAIAHELVVFEDGVLGFLIDNTWVPQIFIFLNAFGCMKCKQIEVYVLGLFI